MMTEEKLMKLAKPCWSFDHMDFDVVSFYRSIMQEQLCSDVELDALNTLAKMFHNAEEVESADGLAILVDMALWNEGCEALEELIGDEDE